MNIRISNADNRPIYQQIEEQIKAAIISGELAFDQQLPSIRFLAKELRISVITTKRAYDELEQQGFINSVPGKGSFVTAQNKELLKEEHLRKMESALRDALKYAKFAGLSFSEICESLCLLIDQGKDE